MRYTHFSKTDRLELSVLLKKGYSLRDIGSALSKNPSSVSREVKRNSVNRVYDPQKAAHRAYVKRRYSKYQGMKVREHTELERYIAEKLKEGWSPDVIAGRWRRERTIPVTITAKGMYKYLYSSYGQRWCRFLKSGQYREKPRTERPKNISIPNRVFIDERPLAITARKRYGDFEGDTLGVPKHTRETVVAVVERKSRYVIAKKIARLKDAMDGLKRILAPLPARSLTLDGGLENARYKELGIPTYFCHPYSSWEKGQIENVFKLLRRYIPKKSDVGLYSQEDISAIVEHINSIPRKILDYQTPKEVFEEQFLKRRRCTSG